MQSSEFIKKYNIICSFKKYDKRKEKKHYLKDVFLNFFSMYNHN